MCINVNNAGDAERKDVVGKRVRLLTHKPQRGFQLFPSKSRHQLAICASIMFQTAAGMGRESDSHTGRE